MTSLRLKNLKNLVEKSFPRAIDPLPIFSFKQLDRLAKEQLKEVYHQLGGQGAQMPLQVPSWQIEIEGVAIALDETLHFNRYRAVSLRSDLYEKNKAFNKDKYLIYCHKYENECLKSGTAAAVWTSPFAERYFGEADTNGRFFEVGAPEWKLLAFKDLLQDITPFFNPLMLLRISIHDEILYEKQLIRLSDLLFNPDQKQQEILVKYLERRIAALKNETVK